MIKSMTGFGRAVCTENNLTVTVEIKSVNHRYFEFSSRLPRGYAFLEEKLKSFCREKIARGKVEVSVSVEENTPANMVVTLNEEYANAYVDALKKLADKYKLKNDLKLSSFVSNADLFTVKKQTVSEEVLTAAVLNTAKEAMNVFVEMRQTEGERLAADIRSRLDTILQKVAFVEEHSPETVYAYRQRLEQKIRELLDQKTVDEQRLLTETAIFADKVAVDEETVRLRSHIRQFGEMLMKENSIGKNMDFLVQEMNREANTIGSKAQDLEIAHTVVEIKAEIEKIREQVQNIE